MCSEGVAAVAARQVRRDAHPLSVEGATYRNPVDLPLFQIVCI